MWAGAREVTQAWLLVAKSGGCPHPSRATRVLRAPLPAVCGWGDLAATFIVIGVGQVGLQVVTTWQKSNWWIYRWQGDVEKTQRPRELSRQFRDQWAAVPSRIIFSRPVCAVPPLDGRFLSADKQSIFIYWSRGFLPHSPNWLDFLQVFLRI